MTRPSLTFPPLALALLALAACGGGNTEPAPPPPPPPGPGPTATVTLSPPSGSVFVTDTLPLTATPKDARGTDLTGKSVTWTSSQPGLATVDASGRVIGVAPGSVTISATVDGVTGTAQLTVTGPLVTGGAPGSATIGPAGGAVSATLPGGGTLALTIPAGDLADPTLITLTPEVPAGSSQAAFQISPTDVVLKHPATLVITVSHGAVVTAASALVFEEDGHDVPAPSTADPAHHSVTVTLSVLGVPPTAQPSSAAFRMPGAGLQRAAAPGNANVMNVALDNYFSDADIGLVNLQQQGTPAAEDVMLVLVQALLQQGIAAVTADPRAAPLLASWRSTVCALTPVAVHVLQAFNFASDYVGLTRVTGDVVKAEIAEELMTAELVRAGVQPSTCQPVLDANAVILAKYQALQPAIQTDLFAFALLPSPRDSMFLADRIKPLLGLAATLIQDGLDPSAKVLTDLVSPQVSRLRTAGYVECGLHLPQTVQARLLVSYSIGGLIASTATFSKSDLESDIQLCGMNIAWRMVDSAGLDIGHGNLGGGSTPGTLTATGRGRIPAVGAVEITGPLQALLCPAGLSANNEQFEVLAGADPQSLSRVALLTPAGNNTYLSVSTLSISTATLRTAAGLGPTTDGTVIVVFHRIGGVCGTGFVNMAHQVLGTLTVDLGPASCSFPSTPMIGAALRLPGGRTRNACATRVVPGNLTITTDAQLAANVDVLRVEGNLTLQGNLTTTDLHELDGLREVTGELRILGVPNLTSLSGVSDMTLMNGLLLSGNPHLVHPVLPVAITDLPGRLGLYNSVVTDLSGFAGLRHTGSLELSITPVASLLPLAHAAVGAVLINQTPLTTLAGLQVSPVMKDVSLLQDPSLTDVSALAPLTDLTGSFELFRPAFPTTAAFANLRTVGGGVQISYDAAGPSSYSFPALVSTNFVSLNADGGCPQGSTAMAAQFPALSSINGLSFAAGAPGVCPIDVNMPNATDRGAFLISGAGLRQLSLKAVVNVTTPLTNMVLTIRSASDLTSVNFSQPVDVEGLIVADNPVLTAIGGFSGRIRKDMRVTDNSHLSTHQINTWPLTVGGTKTVTGNAIP